MNNKIAAALLIIGWITIIIGIAAGFAVGVTMKMHLPGYTYLTEPHPMRWAYGGALILSSVTSGIIFLAFSEIICLLSDIKGNLTGPGSNAAPPAYMSPQLVKENPKHEKPFHLLESEYFQIAGYFSREGKTVKKIIPTPYDDFYFAKLDGNYEVIEIGGIKPRIIPEDYVKEDLKEWKQKNINEFE